MHEHAVVRHRDGRSALLLAIGIDLAGAIFDVVGLPDERRKTHIHVGGPRSVNAAAFVVLAFEPKAIEDLDFIAALQIDAAVAAPLATGRRLKWRAEFDVQLEIGELAFGRVRHAQKIADHLLFAPFIRIGSVEQNDRTFRRLGADGRALTFHSLKLGVDAERKSFRLGIDRTLAVTDGKFGGPFFRIQLGFDFYFFRFRVPAGARQAAFEKIDIELAVAACDDLSGDFLFATDILSLDLVIDRRIGGIGEDVGIFWFPAKFADLVDLGLTR
jgi:hypothetical protein